MRWANTLLWYAAAGFAYWYNSTHDASKLMIPLLPANNLAEATDSGNKTVFLLAVIGTLFLIHAVFTFIVDMFAKKPDAAE